jgi:hypothetical protein
VGSNNVVDKIRLVELRTAQCNSPMLRNLESCIDIRNNWVKNLMRGNNNVTLFILKLPNYFKKSIDKNKQ